MKFDISELKKLLANSLFALGDVVHAQYTAEAVVGDLTPEVQLRPYGNLDEHYIVLSAYVLHNEGAAEDLYWDWRDGNHQENIHTANIASLTKYPLDMSLFSSFPIIMSSNSYLVARASTMTAGKTITAHIWVHNIKGEGFIT